jgi:hypothetical protein
MGKMSEYAHHNLSEKEKPNDLRIFFVNFYSGFFLRNANGLR